jgi:hypothetical protein
VVQGKPRRSNAPRLFCYHWRVLAASKTPAREELSLLLEEFFIG